jgi:Tfp pilus assembly protein PilF
LHRVAGHGRARIATELGEPDAGERYRRALRAHPDDRDLLIGYIAAAESEEARRDILERVAALLATDPAWREGHRALSTALWEQGEQQAFAATYESAIALRPNDAGLWKDYVEALGKADEFAAAAEVCVRAQAATNDLAFAAGAFGFYSASGNLEDADALLERLPADLLRPVAVAKHRLRQRDPAAAEPLLARATSEDPDDIEAWALRGIAWTLLDDPRFDWLNGQDGMIGDDELPVSEGEISSIAERLRELHGRSTTCIGQSLRGGTQTAGNLFDRLEPEIALLRTKLHQAVERYRGMLPPSDQSHPILKHRDSKLGFAGSWSIRLTEGGFHVQHMHPKGILSAASYWVVPSPTMKDSQAGWLEIGGSPAYLGLDMQPLRRIEPKVGRLVLFPSTLHHGTRPFPAGERISVAFDIVAK